MIDYIMISGEIGERVIEYVDHLHEHFVDPCVVVGGAYRAPLAPGFSVRMKQESIGAFEYPHGAEWRARLTRGVKEVPVAGE
jgi:L-fuconate dehydratase